MITWAERIWGSLPPMLGLSIINVALALVLTLTFQIKFCLQSPLWTLVLIIGSRYFPLAWPHQKELCGTRVLVGPEPYVPSGDLEKLPWCLLPALLDLWVTQTPDFILYSGPITPNCTSPCWQLLGMTWSHTLHFLGSSCCHHLHYAPSVYSLSSRSSLRLSVSSQCQEWGCAQVCPERRCLVYGVRLLASNSSSRALQPWTGSSITLLPQFPHCKVKIASWSCWGN